MKRLLTLGLVLTLMITQLSSIQAAESDDAAKVLHAINILRGDGTSFNLDQQLNRAEGATFIVRMLGEEQSVMADRGHYVMTGFSDIAATDWYAPYVGYCVENGIINGFTDGTYKPMESLNEKALLKVLLVALGYEYEKDFDWNHVFQTAYDAGLVQASHYKEGVGQSTDFTRGDVVSLIYRTLKMNHHVTGQKMAVNLLQDTTISEADLIGQGLLVKAGTNKVDELRRVSENYFSLIFTSVPKEVTSDHVMITDDLGDDLEVLSVKRTDMKNVYSVETAQEDKDRLYTLTVRDVVDEYGNAFDDYTTTFTGYRPEVYSSDIFAISKIQQTGSNRLDIVFTHPLNEKSLKEEYFYILHKDNSYADGRNKDELRVSMKDKYTATLKVLDKSFDKDEEYTLVVRNELRSDYRVYLNQHEDDTIRFVAKKSSESEDSMVVDDIYLLDDKTLALRINRNILESIGEQVYSYYLTDEKDRPMSIEKVTVNNLEDEALVLLETRDDMDEEDEYHILINQMYTMDRSESILEKKYTFEAEIKEPKEVTVDGVNQVDNHTIEIYFDQAMNKDSVEDITQYSFQVYHGTTSYKPVAAYYNEEDESVRLYFDDKITIQRNVDYRIIANQDLLSKDGQKLKSSYVDRFEGRDKDTIEIGVDRAIYLGDQMILMTFEEPIGFNETNIGVDNYSLISYDTKEDRSKQKNSSSEVIDAVIYYDSKHLLILTDDFDTDKVYQIRIDALYNYSNFYSAKFLSVDVDIASK